MNNKLIPSAIAGAVVGALVLTGCSDEPSDDFKDRCKQAGGSIERENDYEALGMAPIGFGVPKPPAPAPKAPSVPKAPKPAAPKMEVPKTPKLPKNDAPKPNKPRTPSVTTAPNGNGLALGSNSTPKPKKSKKKSKKHDDNDFLCVKGGDVLFEEDE